MSIFNNIIQETVVLLKKKHWQLVTAESCTGGLLASFLTEIPGSSVWFERGFVVYSNLAKEEMLAVPKQLIETHGAVSEHVAAAMALGALKHSAGHVAVSITGIAGPDGGSIEKPVGTVCFGWAIPGMDIKTIQKQFTGTRQEIRLAACGEALSGVFSSLQPRSNSPSP
jgi:nicotinamide-nucleotide amidase